MKARFLGFSLILFIIGSCTFFDDFEEVPMFLDVETVDFQSVSGQGSNTHGIEDISVYADGFNIGVFPLPAEVPVLDDNNSTKITIRPVVRINGQQDNPVEFPFYDGLEYEFDFLPDSRRIIEPVFKYRDDVRFIFIEDFEGQHRISLDIDQNSSFTIRKSQDARSGTFSGSITTSNTSPFWEKAALDIYPVSDVSSSLIYLEMDYKCEVEFRVGIIGYNGTIAKREYKIVLLPSEEWNKLYLDISPEILSNNFEQYQLVFSSLPNAINFGEVQFDNIKIVAF